MIKYKIIDKLLPDMLISGYCLNKRQRFEFPSISCTFTFAISNPSSCHYSTSRWL